MVTIHPDWAYLPGHPDVYYSAPHRGSGNHYAFPTKFINAIAKRPISNYSAQVNDERMKERCRNWRENYLSQHADPSSG